MDKQSKFTKGLHWTTIASEKLLLAIIGIATCVASALYIFDMFLAQKITLNSCNASNYYCDYGFMQTDSYAK
jgi:hypothetical protein